MIHVISAKNDLFVWEKLSDMCHFFLDRFGFANVEFKWLPERIYTLQINTGRKSANGHMEAFVFHPCRR